MKETLKIIGIVILGYLSISLTSQKNDDISSSINVLISEKTFATNAQINFSLIGTYEFKTAEKKENHYIVIDSINGKLIGKYYGTEDESEHGVFYYANEMENISFANNNISFEIGKRELYSSTQMRITNQKNKLNKGKSVGFTNTKLKYTGKFIENGFELTCESKFGDCWEKEMKFNKLKK